MKKRSSINRRDFLRMSGSAAIYGTVVGGIGHVYDSIIDYLDGNIGKLKKRLSEYDDKVENLPDYNPKKLAKKAEDLRGNFLKKFFKIKEKKKIKIKKPEEEITRRDFLKRFRINYAGAKGAGIGSVYGGAKSYLKGLDRREKRGYAEDISSLKSEMKKLRKFYEELNGYKGNFDKIPKKIEDEISKLEKKIKEIPKGLEGKAEEEYPPFPTVGVIGLIGSIVFFSISITGNVIANSVTNNFMGVVGVLLFIMSLLLIYKNLKMRKDYF